MPDTMSTAPSTPRNRALYAAIAVALAALALASRQHAATLHPFVARYAGDTLWASMVFALVGAAFARASCARVAAFAIAASYAVEASQLYQAPWIVDVRRTWAGGLLLGHGFLWSDVACYGVGVLVALATELVAREGARRRVMAAAAP